MLNVIDTTATSTVVSTFPIRSANGRTRSAANARVSVNSRKNGAIMDAHRQWATRPADEAVYTFDELLTKTRNVRGSSFELDPQSWKDLEVVPHNDGLELRGPLGGAMLGHWSTKQLCSVVEAPADYLMRMPPKIAADCLTHGLESQTRRKGSAQLLVHRTESGRRSLRSITSEVYERVWDAEIAELAYGLHTNGTWGPCEAFKSATSERVSVAWAPSDRLPLGWVGDRSSFIALADYKGAVKVNGTLMARFALISNSEVGAQKLKIVFGLMDFACANFILWGCQQVTELNVMHVGSIRERFADVSRAMSLGLESGERDKIKSGLKLAQNTLIAEDQKTVFTRVSQITRLPKAHIQDAWERAEGTPRYGDPRSVYGMLAGLTEASQFIHKNADKRTASDMAAARLMDLI